MKMTEEWIRIYEKKSGDKHSIPKGMIMLTDRNKGFVVFGVSPDKQTLFVYETCGDGKYWYMKCVNVCRGHNIPKLMTVCTRAIIPYLRLMKGTIIEKSVEKKAEKGKLFYAYRINGINGMGKPFECFGAWYDHQKQRSAYFIITEV